MNNIRNKINYTIDQTLKQINSCTDSACLTEGYNTAELSTLGKLKADIDQTLEQINICKNTMCQNERNNVIVGADEVSVIPLLNANQQVSQINEYSNGAKCVNKGSNIIISRP